MSAAIVCVECGMSAAECYRGCADQCADPICCEVLMPKEPTTYERVLALDSAFQAEVVRQFGKRDAGTMRYYPKAFDARTVAAHDKWQAAMEELLAAMRGAR